MSAHVEEVDSRVAELESMGFDKDKVGRALNRTTEINEAVDMLAMRRLPSEDGFDILAKAEDPYGAAKGRKRPEARPKDPDKGGFRAGLGADASIAEIVDARFEKFKEMGFSVAEAEEALRACKNDVDAALSMILKAKEQPASSDSPHDVLAGAEDPYGAGKPRKRSGTEPAKDPNKGRYVEGLDHASPGVVLDARLTAFLDMGFSTADAERALAACDNDVDATLSMLLAAKTDGDSDLSPHDVLASADDPYGAGKPRKRSGTEPAKDPNKGRYVEGVKADATPAEVLDARLSAFRDMGFSTADAEQALQFCDNDVDAALSMLLQASQDAASA